MTLAERDGRCSAGKPFPAASSAAQLRTAVGRGSPLPRLARVWFTIRCPHRPHACTLAHTPQAYNREPKAPLGRVILTSYFCSKSEDQANFEFNLNAYPKVRARSAVVVNGSSRSGGAA